ncbi:hypothetical protein TVAG_005450 [Trichomonas vaginalis G3]|uniref:Uncharacterized protein n=1 Tax=Trichomonas vaginalis (strain ATCC PRA-98 / G3) TaxID=412133 RepID=A2ENS5_TRIV3|nr:RNA recognition motif-containing family [Trichomonas vaginalis G3]EAY05701.1 hypothetical protein TVAG_005450 [Trichomonas vaginalis G3]KAI5506881.1 RNA recognition motif-containing family [Trichomonas vaginalis G3]|eukprot:XP_001317924.1 hypothetical protein [Trichomonas vaginalis G3]
MLKKSFFLKREIKGLFIEHPIKNIAIHDNIFFYYDVDGYIKIFDAIKDVNDTFNKPFTITSFPIDIALNGAHTFGAVSFNGGSIVIFDLIERKIWKTLNRVTGKSLNHILFLKDDCIIAVDEAKKLIKFVMKNSFIGASVEEIKICSFATTPLHFIIPPIFKSSENYSGLATQSSCLSSKYYGTVGISFPSKFILAQVLNDFSIIVELPFENSIPALYLTDSETLYVALGTQDQVVIYKICAINSIKPEFICFESIQQKPIYMSFLSQSILVAVYSDLTCTVFMFNQNRRFESFIDVKGKLVTTSENIGVVADDAIWTLYFHTFSDKMDQLRLMHDIRGALALCRLATIGDETAGIDLPSGTEMRSLIIEKELSPLLDEDIRNKLKENKDKADELITYLIDLSRELNMNEYMINYAMKIFEEYGLMELFVTKIVENDPKQQFFFVNEKFFDYVIKFSKNIANVDDFILSLPSKFANPNKILEYSYENNKPWLSARIYAYKLNDYLSAIKTLSSIDDFETISKILLSISKISISQMSEIISWLCSSSKENRFPFLFKLITKGKEVDEILRNLSLFVSENNIPFDISTFLTAILYVLSCLNVKSTDRLWKVSEEIISKNIVKIPTFLLDFVLRNIFTKEYVEPDMREVTLMSILTMDLSAKFKMNLLPLILSFHFKNAKQFILLNCGDYDVILKNYIMERESPMPYLLKQSRFKDQENENLLLAIAKNSLGILEIDKQNFVTFLLENYQNSLDFILENIDGFHAQGCLIHELLKKDKKLKFTKMVIVNYSIYLNYYYPNEIKEIIENYSDVDFSLLVNHLVKQRNFELAIKICSNQEIKRKLIVTFIREELYQMKLSSLMIAIHEYKDELDFASSRAVIRSLSIPLMNLAENKNEKQLSLLSNVIEFTHNSLQDNFSVPNFIFVVEKSLNESKYYDMRKELAIYMSGIERDIDCNSELVSKHKELCTTFINVEFNTNDEISEEERISKENSEKERKQKEEQEKERIRKEQEEKERLEREKKLEEERIAKEKKEEEERLAKAEKERLEKERKAEEERKQKEMEEQQRLEQERKEKEEQEKERIRKEQEEKERLEKEKKLEEERLLKEKEEQERIEREKKQKELEEQQRLEKERKLEEERIAKEKAEKERIEKEEQEKLERERKAEEERIQKEKEEELEKERIRQEKERIEREKKEEEERLAKEKKEREEQERKQKELEEQQRLERERKAEEERKRKEQEEKERIEREKKLEEERLRKEKEEQERKEKERLEKLKKEEEERIAREKKAEEERKRKELEEQQRLEKEKKEEEERIAKEKAEKERLERERKAEEERKQKELEEQQRLERERKEKEEQEKERIRKEQEEKERLEREKKLEEERLLKEKEEQERKAEEERKEKERLEKLKKEEEERIAREKKAEEEKKQKELEEQQRLEKERKAEEERKRKEQEEKERREKEEQEKLEREKKLEEERIQKEKEEKERKQKEEEEEKNSKEKEVSSEYEDSESSVSLPVAVKSREIEVEDDDEAALLDDPGMEDDGNEEGYEENSDFYDDDDDDDEGLSVLTKVVEEPPPQTKKAAKEYSSDEYTSSYTASESEYSSSYTD